MTTKRKTRAFGLVGMMAVLAVVAAACVTPGAPPPAQTTGNWKIEATTLTVVDDNNDCFGACQADEPYLVNLAFRVQFNTPNSASTFVVHNVSNELTCPGGTWFFPFGSDGCSTGESTAVPAAMGRINFPGMKLTDVSDLLYGYSPEVAGSFTFAYEEDQVFGSGNVAATVQSFADALKNVLNSTIAVGSLPTDGNAAAALIVDVIGDVALDFVGNTILGLLSGLGNADDLIGVAPVLIVGATGTLADLVNLAGLSGTAVLNGAMYTASVPVNTNVTYTEQSLGGFNIGSNDTNYRVNWNVGYY